MLSIDGSTGEVFLGEVPVVDAARRDLPRGGPRRGAGGRRRRPARPGARRRPAAAPRRPHAAPAGARERRHGRGRRTRARRMGAEGIGLCRTEHMFLGERRALIERLILADSDRAERDAALAELLPLQREDFVELLAAMDGLPTTIRLLDPPLHEFLPDRTELAVRVAVARKRPASPTRPTCACSRPSSGCTSPTRCSACAACGSGWSCPGCSPCRCARSSRPPRQRKRDGGDPRVEIMVPLVGSVMELHLVRDETDSVVAEAPEGVELRRPDRHDDRAAAGRAHRAADRRGRPSSSPSAPTTSPRRRGASPATTSRPRSSPAYLDKGVFTVSPFEIARRATASARLVRMAVESGRRTAAGPQARRLRRARRRPGVGALLPRRRGSTTSRAHPSGCRWRAWRPAGPRSSPRRGAFRTDRKPPPTGVVSARARRPRSSRAAEHLAVDDREPAVVLRGPRAPGRGN